MKNSEVYKRTVEFLTNRPKTYCYFCNKPTGQKDYVIPKFDFEKAVFIEQHICRQCKDKVMAK